MPGADLKYSDSELEESGDLKVAEVRTLRRNLTGSCVERTLHRVRSNGLTVLLLACIIYLSARLTLGDNKAIRFCVEKQWSSIHRQIADEPVQLRVQRLLKHHPLVDTHIDLPELARWKFQNHINGDAFRLDREGFPGHVDIPRMRQGRMGGAFWSVYTDCPPDHNDTSGRGTLLQVRDTLQQIDVTKRIVERFSDDMALATSAQAFYDSFSDGKIAGVMGAEGLHQIGNSVAALRQYHALGVRYMTLTHFCNNQFADSCSMPPIHHGLSELGVGVVREMNRIGMIVDLSHTSDDTMRAALDVSTGPVIFSHSGAKGIFDSPRNAPDDVLLKLKDNGGVINIVFMPEYLGSDYRKVTIDTVADHVLYVADKIGWAHVGIGSDFDGVMHLPQGLDSVARYPDLIQTVIERASQPPTDIELIGFIGGNVLRVWRQVEEESERLKKKGTMPLELDEVLAL